MDGIILDRNVKLAARDIDKALCGIFVIFGVEAVPPGIQRQISAGDPDRVIGLDRVTGGGDEIFPAGDFEVVLADNTVIL